MAMDLAVLALSVMKQGEEEIPGLTDKVLPKRLGPKRATKIRKFFGLGKDDDVSLLACLLHFIIMFFLLEPARPSLFSCAWVGFAARSLGTDRSVWFELNADIEVCTFPGPQIRHPPRSSTQGRRKETLHQSSPYPASRHSPASPA